MKNKKKVLLILLFVFFALSNAGAIDFYSKPECAPGGTIFINLSIMDYSFRFGEAQSIEYPIFRPSIDWMIPLFPPVTFGAFVAPPDTVIRVVLNYGLRIAYHLDFDNPSSDFYLLYTYDFGYLNNPQLVAKHYKPIPQNFFDFRAGYRHMFNKFGAFLESGYGFQTLYFGLCLKL
jgi:hypothetical protein